MSTDERIAEAALAEKMEWYAELCVKALDDSCADGIHDRQPDEFEGETVWSCSWCGLPV